MNRKDYVKSIIVYTDVNQTKISVRATIITLLGFCLFWWFFCLVFVFEMLTGREIDEDIGKEED